MMPVASADQEKVLRVGYQKFNTLNILKGTHNLENALAEKGIKVAWYEFAAGPQLLEALVTGSLDIGHAADTPAVYAQAANKPITYLAAEQPYPKGMGIIVNGDSNVKSIADLKGKKIATGRGWNVQYLLLVALKEAGLSPADVELNYVSSMSDAVAALQSGSVSAATVWDPFLPGLEKNQGFRNIRDGEGLSTNRTFYISTAKFADENKDTLRIFFRELAKVSDWANKNPVEVANLMSPQLGIPSDVLLVATQRRNYNAVQMSPAIVAEQQKQADTFVDLGILPKRFRVSDAVYSESLLPK